MKLASLRDGTRDGKLVVVSRDLTHYTDAGTVAPTLQAALDDWANLAPRLEQLSAQVAADTVPLGRFHERDALAPLPRAYQWIDSSAYVSHIELVRRARGIDMPASFWTEPLVYQGGSDSFLAPREAIVVTDEALGIDMEAEFAVITDDVPMGSDIHRAQESIRLVMLANDVSLRSLIPAEIDRGFGFFQSKPSSAFSPVAVTPDELGDAWDGRRLSLPMRVDVNGVAFGRVETGQDMTFDMPTLIAHAARTRSLCTGSIIGSGTVSNRDENGEFSKAVADGGRGYSCIAELRMVETIVNGEPTTQFLRFGDVVRIEMLSRDGDSIFGAIEQTVEKA